MGSHVRVVDGAVSLKPALDWAYTAISKGLEGGAVGIHIYRHEEMRTPEQNSKSWPMYHDLSDQILWYGEKLSPEHWKELLSNEWQNQKIVPGISGGFCALGVRTSKMKKREFSELIEIIYCFGANHGVKWSEPALKEFEKYREAKK